MTAPVSSHTWLVAAAYLAAGIIGAIAARAIFTRLQRRAERTRWRGHDIVLAFMRSVVPWCVGVGCVWGAILALPLKAAYRFDLDHALLAVIVVVISIGSAKVAGAVVHHGRRPAAASRDRPPSS